MTRNSDAHDVHEILVNLRFLVIFHILSVVAVIVAAAWLFGQ